MHFADEEIPALFHRDPELAWRIFIEKYADVIFATLQRLGFDYDEAMDRFVYICEKLCEQDFRRLKSIRHAGSFGDLTPWVRTVAQNLSVNWLWSVEGRKRRLKPITRLPLQDQRVFEMYFWKGLSPSQVTEQLRLEHQDIQLASVLDSLERIFSVLSQKKLWRLMGNLARARREISLDEINPETGMNLDPKDPSMNPEESVLEKEATAKMSQALKELSVRERLAVQMRYEDGLELWEIKKILGRPEKEIKNSLKTAIQKLRSIHRPYP